MMMSSLTANESIWESYKIVVCSLSLKSRLSLGAVDIAWNVTGYTFFFKELISFELFPN